MQAGIWAERCSKDTWRLGKLHTRWKTLGKLSVGKMPLEKSLTYKTDLAELLESFSVLAASCLSLARSVKASVLKGSEIIPSCSTRTWSRKSLEAGRSVKVSWVEELEMFLTSFKVWASNTWGSRIINTRMGEQNWKGIEFCHKLKVVNPYIFETRLM